MGEVCLEVEFTLPREASQSIHFCPSDNENLIRTLRYICTTLLEKASYRTTLPELGLNLRKCSVSKRSNIQCVFTFQSVEYKKGLMTQLKNVFPDLYTFKEIWLTLDNIPVWVDNDMLQRKITINGVKIERGYDEFAIPNGSAKIVFYNYGALGWFLSTCKGDMWHKPIIVKACVKGVWLSLGDFLKEKPHLMQKVSWHKSGMIEEGAVNAGVVSTTGSQLSVPDRAPKEANVEVPITESNAISSTSIDVEAGACEKYVCTKALLEDDVLKGGVETEARDRWKDTVTLNAVSLQEFIQPEYTVVGRNRKFIIPGEATRDAYIAGLISSKERLISSYGSDFYVVARGRKIGLFKNYAGVKTVCDGFPGGVHAHFSNFDDAIEFLHQKVCAEPTARMQSRGEEDTSLSVSEMGKRHRSPNDHLSPSMESLLSPRKVGKVGMKVAETKSEHDSVVKSLFTSEDAAAWE